MQSKYKLRSAHKDARGFEYILYAAFSWSLIVTLLLLPLAPVFANEDALIIPEVISETLVEEVIEVEVPEEIVIEESAEEVSVETLGDVTEEIEIESSETVIVNDVGSVEEEIEIPVAEIVVDTVSTSSSDTTVESSSTSTEVSATSTDSGDDLEQPVVEDVVEADTSSPTQAEPNEEVIVVNETNEQELVESTETSPLEDDNSEEESDEVTTPEVTEATFVNEVTNDENRFSFAKNECTLVGDGSFYCAKQQDEVEVTYTNRVFSAVDADGDKEIFIESEGDILQVTDNTYDDDAPQYDELSGSIVWHRLIQGRYQIISYDTNTGRETQVTFDRYNNMHPNNFDKTMVWQGWIGDDWEIFMLEDGELTMLTDNTVHDIAPHINGTHVIWQSFESNAWVMKVYDLRTKKIETVYANDGGSIENPRFVLVYDTKYESGDVHTRGYDLASGEIVELGVEPVKVPTQLPDPDQTGEERALVSPSVAPKSKSENSDDNLDDEGQDTDNVEVSDIVIPSLTDTSTSTAASSTISLDTTLGDIEVPALDTASIEEAEITDLIVTPFVEPIESDDADSLDSQSVVATST